MNTSGENSHLSETPSAVAPQTGAGSQAQAEPGGVPSPGAPPGPQGGQPEGASQPVDLIALLKFAEGIDHRVLSQVFSLGALRTQQFHPGQIVFQQGAPVTAIYAILSGRVGEVRRSPGADGRTRQTLCREVGPGTVLGVYDFLFDTTYSTRARAVEETNLLVIDARALGKLVFRYPHVRERLAPLDLISRLRTLPFIGPLDVVAHGFLAECAARETFPHEHPIYEAGALLDRVWFVDQGQVRLTAPPREDGTPGETMWLGNGAVFGFGVAGQTRAPGGAAVGRRAAHTAHVSTTQPAKLIAIPYEYFVDVAGVDPDLAGRQEIDRRQQAIDNMYVFHQLHPAERRELVGCFSHYFIPHNYLLIQQGEEADSLWVLMADARATIRALDSRGEQMITTQTRGQTYFAENALWGQTTQDSTVEALPTSQWLRLHWSDFQYFEHHAHVKLLPRLALDPTKMRDKSAPEDQGRYHFDWVEPGERVILFSHRHWIALLRKSLPAIIVFGILIAIWLLTEILPGTQEFLRWAFRVIVFVFIIPLTIWGIIDYLNDWIVVTTRRVVHQEKVLFVNEWRKEAPLEQIQSVDFQTTWLGKWLNYGTMTVRTAATLGAITFEYTTGFTKLRETIMEQRAQRQSHTMAQSKMGINQVLERRLGLKVTLPSRVWSPIAGTPAHLRLGKGADKTRRRGTGASDGAQRPPSGGETKAGESKIVWRKHWIILVPRLFGPAALFLLGLAGAVALVWGLPVDLEPQWTTLVRGVGFLLLLAGAGAVLWITWIIADWHNDTYELDSEMIVHIDKMPLGISENRKSTTLNRIQNVTLSIPSPIHWIFDFGNVFVQTAAEVGEFNFHAVPDPRAVVDEIQLRLSELRRSEEKQAMLRRAEELPDWFEVYNRLEPDLIKPPPGDA